MLSEASALGGEVEDCHLINDRIKQNTVWFPLSYSFAGVWAELIVEIRAIPLWDLDWTAGGKKMTLFLVFDEIFAEIVCPVVALAHVWAPTHTKNIQRHYNKCSGKVELKQDDSKWSEWEKKCSQNEEF